MCSMHGKIWMIFANSFPLEVAMQVSVYAAELVLYNCARANKLTIHAIVLTKSCSSNAVGLCQALDDLTFVKGDHFVRVVKGH